MHRRRLSKHAASAGRLRRWLAALLWLMAIALQAQQMITGTVTDEQTGEPLPFANVYYENGAVSQTDLKGNFKKPWKRGKLFVSIVGYEARSFHIKTSTHLDVKLSPLPNIMGEAVVKGRKEKYSRKNNPAVTLMERVIAAKQKNDLHRRDYFSLHKYSTMLFAFDDMKPENFDEGLFKPLAALRNSLEPCNETGRLVLPLSVEETATNVVWNKESGQQKEIVLGKRSNGLNDIVSTGENLNLLLKDVFSDINIYDDDLRLFRYQFHSPLSSKHAISFYRFFLGDTIDVEGTRCISVGFTPNNQQDFGFSGTLYITADSTYRLHMADMGLPYNSDVNFVRDLRLIQRFAPLPSGEQVLTEDRMLVQLSVFDLVKPVMVKRTTQFSHFDFQPLQAKVFQFDGNLRIDPNAQLRTEEFWNSFTNESPHETQESMANTVETLRRSKGFKLIMPVLQVLVENFLETGQRSKFDIGPVNTIVSFNKVETMRLRASGQTTAFLNPHLFAKGYVAYGFKDHRWKGGLELTYALNRKAYGPHEFPMKNLTLAYRNDVISPSDKFLGHDKDNVFKSLKWSGTDLMLYYESFSAGYVHEWSNGLQLSAKLYHDRMVPTLSMFYQYQSPIGVSTDPADHLARLHNTNLTLALRYQPGTTYMNTKQNRFATNHEAPILTLAHTMGLKGVWLAEYNTNLTEATLYKRFWVGSWGKIDLYMKAEAQWNKVPYPFLIIPAANQSFFSEKATFSMIKNMEFLSDRQVSAHATWHLNGKILNRIPLVRKLKLRECIGVSALWGHLTSKNNPFVHPEDGELMYFPVKWHADGSYEFLSRPIDSDHPYVEAYVGLYNIFKVFRVDLVHRFTHHDSPDIKKWGVRFKFELTF